MNRAEQKLADIRKRELARVRAEIAKKKKKKLAALRQRNLDRVRGKVLRAKQARLKREAKVKAKALRSQLQALRERNRIARDNANLAPLQDSPYFAPVSAPVHIPLISPFPAMLPPPNADRFISTGRPRPSAPSAPLHALPTVRSTRVRDFLASEPSGVVPFTSFTRTESKQAAINEMNDEMGEEKKDSGVIVNEAQRHPTDDFKVVNGVKVYRNPTPAQRKRTNKQFRKRGVNRPTWGTYSPSNLALARAGQHRPIYVDELPVVVDIDSMPTFLLNMFNNSWNTRVFPNEASLILDAFFTRMYNQERYYNLRYNIKGTTAWNNIVRDHNTERKTNHRASLSPGRASEAKRGPLDDGNKGIRWRAANVGNTLWKRVLLRQRTTLSEVESLKAGSDVDGALEDVFAIKGPRFEVFDPAKKFSNSDAAFFPMVHDIERLNLANYQIYREDQLPGGNTIQFNFETERHLIGIYDDTNCLMYSLLHHNDLELSEYEMIKLGLGGFNEAGKYVKASTEFKEVAEKLDVTFKVRKYRKVAGRGVAAARDKVECDIYNPGCEKVVELALYKNHIFKYELTNYPAWPFSTTKRAIREDYFGQWVEAGCPISKHHPFNHNFCRSHRLNSETKINSLRLVMRLNRLGKFRTSERLKEVNLNVDRPVTLDYVDVEQQLHKPKEPRVSKSDEPLLPRIVVCADIETIPITEDDERHDETKEEVVKRGHTALYIGYKIRGGGYHRIYQEDHPGEPLGKLMFDQLSEMYNSRQNCHNYSNRHVLVYFHNLKYDLHVMLRDGLEVESILNTDGTFYSSNHRRGKLLFNIRDSYKMISAALGKFGKMFKLECAKKDVIAYEYHNLNHKTRMANPRVSIEEYAKYLNEPETTDVTFDDVSPRDRQLQQLRSNIDADRELYEYDEDTDTFNPWEYYKDYLEYDCLTLEAGILKFRDICLDKFGLDTDDYYTISSLADAIIRTKGCYEGAFEVKGNLRKFLSKSVVGGRVEAFKKQQLIDECIQALDACSLYPTAIARMKSEGLGVPMGPLVTIPEDITNEELMKSPMFFADIEITKIGRRRVTPLISIKDDVGTLRMTNDGLGVHNVNKTTLEDYIKYHEIEYRIISGVHFPPGTEFNTKICDVIIEIYAMRLDAKKVGNSALSEVLKLVLNSIYGKTIQRMYEDRQLIMSLDRFPTYAYRNVNRFVKAIQINATQVMVTETTHDKSVAMTYLGSMILSMSKRVMNEVIDVIEELGVNLYYTDTDSLHIDNDRIPEIAKEFERRHGRELLGNQMGQFHSDFDLHYTNEHGVKCKAFNVTSYKSLYFDKKVYCELLVGTGIINGEEVEIRGHHKRMKGFSEDGLDKMIEDHYNNEPIELYKDICVNRIRINNVVPGRRPRFKYDKFFSVYTVTEDFRSIGNAPVVKPVVKRRRLKIVSGPSSPAVVTRVTASGRKLRIRS